MPAISVVVPTLGRSAALTQVIASLDAHARHDQIEVIVVIDALGAHGTLDARTFPGLGSRLSVLRADRPGASAARNAGWRRAAAELVLFIDDDIVAQPQLVFEHLQWHRQHREPEVGVLGAVRWSPQVKVTPFMRWLESGILFDFDRIEGCDAGWGRFYSCNASVKRALLERVNGFDEVAFPFRYEDLDLARRMADHGFRLLYNRRAVGEHLKTETLESWRRNLRQNAVGERRFVSRYPDTRPYFHDRFQAAVDAPVARGRTGRLTRWIGPRVPWIGPIAWRSFDRVCSQRLGSEFLREWDSVGRTDGNDDGR